MKPFRSCARVRRPYAARPLPTRTNPVQSLSVVYRYIDQLKPNPANPRRHDRRQIRRLAKIIEKFGFRVPILCDSNDMVVAGHARLAAAPLAGLTEVPTIKIDDLTDAEIQAFVIADNRIAELATWDERRLAEQFLELSQVKPELNLEITGFDVGQIDFRIENLSPATPRDPDPADAMPRASASPISKPGDIWLLHENRILCGDARESESYAKLLGRSRATAVFADAPYNVKVRSISGRGKVRHAEFAMASGEMSEPEFTRFLTKIFSQLRTHSVDGAVIFECIDWRHVWEALGAARNSGCAVLNLAVWVKSNPGLGSFYRGQHELVLVLKSGHSRHRNNIELGRHGRNRSNVWTYPSVNDFGRGAGEGNLLQQHPTPKPVALVADAIMDTTARGDIVLDPFIGSGSTIIAAERTGRRCFGIEINPAYVDVAVRRWQAWTRDVARHAETGLTFDEMCQGKGVRRGR